MSQIEQAVKLSRRLETLLEQKYHATGKGLHEKTSSVEAKLPTDLVKSLRYIATMRNSVVHEEGFVIENLARFQAQGDSALAQLAGVPLPISGRNGKVVSPFMEWAQLIILLVCIVAGTVLGMKITGGWLGAGIGLLLGMSLGAHLTGNAK